jgi:DNA-binding GntR family transcriptional regulator
MPGPQPHKQLHHAVADQLRAAIQTGNLKPGEWLRQERLAQELGVSQMPVREALKELIAEGLVEHLPYRGVRVVEFSPDDVEEVYTHRSFLEGRAAFIAAKEITPEEIALLKDLQEQMKKMGPKHIAEYRELNRRFHQVIFTACRKPYLIHTLTQLWPFFPSMLLNNFSDIAMRPIPGRERLDPQEHDAIITALERRAASQAARLTRHHIESAGTQLIAAVRHK